MPCLILPREPSEKEVATQRTETRYHTILFDAAVKLDATKRLVYSDPIEGTRYLYPTGTRNIAESSVVWLVEAEEYPSP